MTSPLRCFLRNKRGSLTVEATLCLPLLILWAFICVSLVFTIHATLVLDRAVADACGNMAELSYLLNRARVLGLSALKSNKKISGIVDVFSSPAASELQGHLGGRALADLYLNGSLKDYPEIPSCVTWKLARLPFPDSDDSGKGSIDRTIVNGLINWEGYVFDQDDVALVLSFKPAQLNRYTSLLPGSWEITIMKRQRAWLTGRDLPPGRGEEQAAGKKGDGPIVYITNWGVKYHVEDCRYLRLSRYPAYLNQLSRSYGACSVCKPPAREGP